MIIEIKVRLAHRSPLRVLYSHKYLTQARLVLNLVRIVTA